MARCRHRGAAVTYHGDYSRRRLLAGHSITVSGRREAGEQREEGERSRKTDGGGRKTQSCASGVHGGAERLWQDAGTESSAQTGRQEEKCAGVGKSCREERDGVVRKDSGFYGRPKPLTQHAER